MQTPLLSWTPGNWIQAVAGCGTATRGPLGNAGKCSPGAPRSRRYFRCGRLRSRPSGSFWEVSDSRDPTTSFKFLVWSWDPARRALGDREGKSRPVAARLRDGAAACLPLARVLRSGSGSRAGRRTRLRGGRGSRGSCCPARRPLTFHTLRHFCNLIFLCLSFLFWKRGYYLPHTFALGINGIGQVKC